MIRISYLNDALWICHDDALSPELHALTLSNRFQVFESMNQVFHLRAIEMDRDGVPSAHLGQLQVLDVFPLVCSVLPLENERALHPPSAFTWFADELGPKNPARCSRLAQ